MRSHAIYAGVLAGLAAAQNATSNMSLTDVLAANSGTLSVLTSLVQNDTSLLDTLNSTSNITILAPSNDALDTFVNSTSLNVTEALDSGVLTALLSYHVLNGTYYSSMFNDTPMFIPSLLDNSTYENVTGGQVVEGVMKGDNVSFYSAVKRVSNVTKADLNFTGGVIHVIDKVLEIPLNLSATAVEANLSAAAGALTSAGGDLVSSLEAMENITVFAPSNQAFEAIGSILGNLSSSMLTSILEYHVVEGTVGYSSDLMNETLDTAAGTPVNIRVTNGSVYVNSAKVIVPDVLIANGVVHVIDSVLNPNSTSNNSTAIPSTTTAAFTGASSATSGGVPFTSGVPSPTGTETGAAPAGTTGAAPHATAGAALGALLAGIAFAVNGL